jgi:hypothetical protein
MPVSGSFDFRFFFLVAMILFLYTLYIMGYIREGGDNGMKMRNRMEGMESIERDGEEG